MRSLFDSSAIFKAIKENKIEVLTGNLTLELARYELGNIIWKDTVLQAKISEHDAKITANVIKHTLNLMEVIGIAGYEEEILETAIQYKITFYDASYAYLAKAKSLQLVTEDLRLTKKITPTINVSTLENMKLRKEAEK
jgi:predicted nucleic acid-binding protein